MKKFVIGEKYGRSGLSQAEKNEAYERLRGEIRDKLGIPDGFLPGFAPYDIAVKDGVIYYKGSRGSSYYVSIPRILVKDGAVMCPCGNKSFTINYGDYECLGICTDCGEVHTLYSG